MKSITNYSKNLGLAFQVIDDIFDLNSNETELGKPVGSDLINGVITLPTLYGMENPDFKSLIKDFFKDTSDILLHRQIIDYLNQSSSVERAYDFAKDLIQSSKTSIESLPKSDSRDSLVSLCDFIITRKD